MRRAITSVCLSLALALGSFGCILLLDGTSDYRLEDSGAPACIDAQVTAPSVPDAAIGDAGATVGGCVACVDRACSLEVAACQENCVCRVAAVALFDCLGAGGTRTDCSAQASIGGVIPELLGLGACLQQSGCAASSCGE